MGAAQGSRWIGAPQSREGGLEKRRLACPCPPVSACLPTSHRALLHPASQARLLFPRTRTLRTDLRAPGGHQPGCLPSDEEERVGLTCPPCSVGTAARGRGPPPRQRPPRRAQWAPSNFFSPLRTEGEHLSNQLQAWLTPAKTAPAPAGQGDQPAGALLLARRPIPASPAHATAATERDPPRPERTFTHGALGEVEGPLAALPLQPRQPAGPGQDAERGQAEPGLSPGMPSCLALSCRALPALHRTSSLDLLLCTRTLPDHWDLVAPGQDPECCFTHEEYQSELAVAI